MEEEFEEGIDWTLLYESDGINRIVNELYSFKVLYFSHEEDQPRVLKMADPLQFKYVVDERFPAGERTTMDVANTRNDPFCPYFHIVLGGVSSDPREVGINYQLQSFLRRIGVSNVPIRCKNALVAAMMNKDGLDSSVDIPKEYHLTSVRPSDWSGPIDITCAFSAIHSRHMKKLCNAQGGCRLDMLPEDVHWKVIRYLRHPCAQMILDYHRDLSEWVSYWDYHFAGVMSRFTLW